MRVVFASTNAGKLREVREIIGDRMEIWTPPMWLGDVETGDTYLENATLKALAVHRMVGGAVLAEDSGLEVDALGGAPGIHSARFGRRRGTTYGQPGYEEGGKAKVLRLLDGVPDERRGARFRAVAVLVLASGRVVVGEGVVDGSIAREPRGSGGFGYDPIFIPAELDGRTAAELDPETKNAVSHRGRALAALLAELDTS